MKTQHFYIDLTQRPPRSFRVRLGNYVVLARMLDKGRATLAGKNGDYIYNSPTDQHLVQVSWLRSRCLVERIGNRQSVTGKSSNGFRPIPRPRALHGRSRPGLLSWKNARRTATPKHLRSLLNTWAGFPKPGKTSKPCSNSANSMTMSALEEKRKPHILTNNEEQKI